MNTKGYFSSADITNYNFLGSRNLNPVRPYKPTQSTSSGEKVDYYLKETPYIFQKNNFTGSNGDKFIIVIENMGFPKGTIGILSDIKLGYATFTDVRTGKKARISVLAGMGLKDYKKIKSKVKDGLIKFSYNPTHGNERLYITEKCFN